MRERDNEEEREREGGRIEEESKTKDCIVHALTLVSLYFCPQVRSDDSNGRGNNVNTLTCGSD